MNTPLSWIKAYVPDLDCTDQEYSDMMTLTGTKVEGYIQLDKNLDKIVVGKILKIDRHPDADKLVICQLDIGDKQIQIVTGATNVAVGQLVPVVLDGGKVAGSHKEGLSENGVKIKKGKLRGIESDGMMCGIDELGSDRNYYPEAPEDGIYVFDIDVHPGDDAIDKLGLHDTVFEYEITSNRVDCYSMIGIAREAAATFGKKLVLPKIKETGNDEDISKYLSVEVRDKDLCPRYCARVVKNIHIAPSPKWLQRRLSNSGIRPINNIVDITNYVMEEYGQPMHAFDYDTIDGHKIIVKRATDGKSFTTLDGAKRNLDGDMLMICDNSKEIGIAGIMGGDNSKITDTVKTMIFEAACFDGTNIRLSSKRLGLRTDASGKFEKGIDPNNCIDAINRACDLIEQLGAGEVVGGTIDIYDKKVTESRVQFDPDAINRLLGTDISREDMIDYLSKVDLIYDKVADEIVAPTFRQDIHRMADIAEEVARFYGYDKIPTTLSKSTATMGRIPDDMRVEDIAREVARFMGFSEAMNYSFESPKVFDKLSIPSDDRLHDAIPIMNPLGEDFSIMRTTPISGMLQSLATNYNRRNKDVRLFEMANIYLPKLLPLQELPDERMQFVLGFYGDGDFYTMKGIIEEFLKAVGMNKKSQYIADCDRPFLHPGRKADISYGKDIIGYLGEIHPLVAKSYDIDTRIYIGVIDIPSMMTYVKFDRKYKGIARFPAVTRDLSMVVAKDIPVGDIEKIIEKGGSHILESYKLFDIYEGDQIKEGYKSVAYTITFRHKDKTLTEAEISIAMDKILQGLQDKGIELRS